MRASSWRVAVLCLLRRALSIAILATGRRLRLMVFVWWMPSVLSLVRATLPGCYGTTHVEVEIVTQRAQFLRYTGEIDLLLAREPGVQAGPSESLQD